MGKDDGRRYVVGMSDASKIGSEKCYDVFHWRNEDEKGLMMLPIGAYYNRKLHNMKRGEYLRFRTDDGFEEPRKILGVCKLDLKSSLAAMMSFYIYKVRLDVVTRKWQSNAIIEGNAKCAVSDRECLLVWYERLER